MPIRRLVARTITDAIKVAVDFINEWAVSTPHYCWFRGINDSTLSLVPGAHWRRRYDEYHSLVSFAQEGVAFHDIGSVDDWKTYYLAQHHGVPTRLLDWTESFASALFFAFDGWKGRKTPRIWILQPGSLNETFLGWHGILAPENIPETQLWLPRQIARTSHLTRQDSDGYVYDNKWPLAIYPKKSNSRIHAQQGTFTVHGRDAQSLDVQLKAQGHDPGDFLAQLDLVRCDRKRALRELALLGIRRRAIYPDLDNFVKEMRENDWQ